MSRTKELYEKLKKKNGTGSDNTTPSSANSQKESEQTGKSSRTKQLYSKLQQQKSEYDAEVSRISAEESLTAYKKAVQRSEVDSMLSKKKYQKKYNDAVEQYKSDIGYDTMSTSEKGNADLYLKYAKDYAGMSADQQKSEAARLYDLKDRDTKSDVVSTMKNITGWDSTGYDVNNDSTVNPRDVISQLRSANGTATNDSEERYKWLLYYGDESLKDDDRYKSDWDYYTSKDNYEASKEKMASLEERYQEEKQKYKNFAAEHNGTEKPLWEIIAEAVGLKETPETDYDKAVIDEYEAAETKVNKYERLTSILNETKDYTKREDFEQYATPGSEATGDYIKNPEERANEEIEKLGEVGVGADFSSDYGGNYSNSYQSNATIKKQYGADTWSGMTDQEKSVYYYIYRTEGETAAKDYLDRIGVVTSKRYQDKISDEAANGSFLDKVGFTLAGAAGSVYGAPSALLEDIVSASEDNYNPYSSGVYNTAQAMKSGVQENMSDVGKFFYGAGTSAIESVVGAGTLGRAYTVIMGMGAASTRAKELWEEGATDEQIVVGATMDGIAEALFEELSVEHLLSDKTVSGVWGWIKERVIKQGAVEASEEALTGFANVFNDVMNRGSQSDTVKKYKAYLEENGGDEEDALKSTLWDIVKEVGLEAAAGAVSGAATGAAYHASELVDVAKMRSTEKSVSNKEEAEKFIDAVESARSYRKMKGTLTAEDDARYQEAEQRVKDKYEVSDDVTITPTGEVTTEKAIRENLTKAVNNAQEAAYSREYLTTDTGETEYADGKGEPEAVTVEKVVEGENGKKAYLLTDGRTVSSETVTFGTKAEASVYGMLLSSAVDADSANTIAKSVLSETEDHSTALTAAQKTRDAISLYNEGNLGLSYKEAVRLTDAKNASTSLMSEAYELGRSAYNERVAEQQSAAERGDMTYKKKGSGQLIYDPSVSAEDKAYLAKGGNNSLSNSDVKALKVLASSLGIDIHLYASHLDANGKRSAFVKGKRRSSNGFYDHATGDIYLDIYAGRSGNSLMLYTVSHEVTHFIKQNSPEQYKALSDYLFSVYGEKGQSVDELVQKQIKKAERKGQTLSYEEALEEVVADSMESMLADGEVIKRLAQEKPGLWQKIVDKIKEIIAKLTKRYNALDPDSVEGKTVKGWVDEFSKIQDLFTAAALDAKENYRKSGVGEATGTREVFSISQFAQATGMRFDPETLELYDEDGNLIDGVNNKVTPAMITNTPFGMLIEMGLSDKAEIFGEQSPQQKAKTMVADLMNLIARYRDSDLVWEIGSTTLSSTFSALKSNSDPQYATTVDFGTICAKTQAIVDTLSEVMVRKIDPKTGMVRDGETPGLTRSEVIEVYNAVNEAGLSVPCPVCYVFSRWMGVPSLLGQMSQFQKDFVVTAKDKSGNTVIDRKATLAKAKSYVREALENYKTKKGVDARKSSLTSKLAKLEEQRIKQEEKLLDNNLSDAKRTKVEATRDEIVADMVACDEELAKVNAYNWITQALCNGKVDAIKDIDNLKIDDAFKLTPDEILFDLNRTAEFAEYKKNWNYRTTRGAGMGKAIMPYGGATIGDFLYGVHAGGRQANNPWLNGNEKKASAQLKNARARARKQNLIGGQRLQSTSDFRPEWGLDYIMAFLELQAAGSYAQMYTKVAEAVDFLASVGADVNLSVMARGAGYHYENGKPVISAEDFSNITGMDYDTAVKLKDKYDSVQLILVGMNDTHIRLALAHSDIDFVIPWHSSGNSKDTLSKLMKGVGEKMDGATNYEDVQNDKIDSNRTEDQKALWEARVKLLTKGGSKLTVQEKELLLSNEYTAELYRRFTEKGYDDVCYGVKLNKSQATQIFPYEYWVTDPSKKGGTKKTANENGRRFVKYCESMGIVPRFEKFSNEDGYWKLLIDRSMYDNKGRYRAQQTIDVTKAKIGDLVNGKLTGGDLPTKAQAKYAPKDPRSPMYEDYTNKQQKAVELAEKALSEREDMRFELTVESAEDEDVSSSERDETPEEAAEEERKSNRAILSNALESAAQTPEEKTNLQRYRDSIDEINKAETRLDEVNAEIKRLSFAEGKRDTARIAELQAEKARLESQIAKADSRLLKLEASQPLKDYVARAKASTKAKMSAEMIEREAELRAQRDAEIERVRLEERWKGAEKNAELRRQRDEAVEAVREKYRERLKEMRTNRNASEIRRKIGNVEKRMRQRLLRPAENKYVTNEMLRPVAELLYELARYNGSGEKAAIAAQAMQEAYLEVASEITPEPVQAEPQNDKEKEAQAKEREQAQKNNPAAALVEQVQRIFDGDRSLRDLTVDELATVYDAAKTIEYLVTSATKTISTEKAISIGRWRQKLVGELKRGKGISFYNIQALRPQTVFEMFGHYTKDSAWSMMYDILNDAQLKTADVVMNLNEIFAHLMPGDGGGVKVKNGTFNDFIDPDNAVDVGLVDEDGNKYTVTHDMLVMLALSLDHPDNYNYIVRNGFVAPDKSRYYKGNTAEAYSKGSTKIVPPTAAENAALYEQRRDLNSELKNDISDERREEIRARLDEIEAQLTQNEEAAREWADDLRRRIGEAMNDYDRDWYESWRAFAEASQKYLNEATQKMYGFDRATVENYFPIRTDSRFGGQSFESIAYDFALENAGFMKAREGTSLKPLYLEGVSYVAQDHIRKVSQYAGMAPALRDVGQVLGKQAKVDGKTSTGVMYELGRVYDKKAEKWLENLIADLNGGRKHESNILGKGLSKLRSKYAGAVLTLNPSVTMGQFASAPTAASVLGWSAVSKAYALHGMPVMGKATSELIAKYTPILYNRNLGVSERSASSVAGAQSNLDLVQQKASFIFNWINAMDMYTVNRLWWAAEYYVRDHSPELYDANAQTQSDEYYTEVARMFNKAVQETQPNYTTLQRPEVLRNPNELVRSLTMFMTQRLQNYSIMYDSVQRYRRYRYDYRHGQNGVTAADVSEARGKLGAAVTSQAAATGMLVLFKALSSFLLYRVDPFRDEDEEITTESVTKHLLDMVLSSGISNLLFGSELYSLVKRWVFGKDEQYYGVEVNGVEQFNSAVDALTAVVDSVFEPMRDGKEIDWKSAGIKLKKAVAKVLETGFGIPATNAGRIADAVINWSSDAVDGTLGEFEQRVGRSKTTNARRLFKAITAKDADKVAKVEAEFADKEEAVSALKEYIGKEYKKGEVDRETVNMILADYAGMSDDDLYWWFDKKDAEIGGDDEYSKYNDFYEAVESGEDLKGVIKSYTDNGVEEKTLASRITQKFKPIYVAASKSEQASLKGYLLNAYELLGYDRDKKAKDIDKWLEN